jgi:hypothetical protein
MTPELLNRWKDKLNIPFNLYDITGDKDIVRLNWGVKSLPQLILTDKLHKVIDEGFAITELDDKIKADENAK